MKNIITILCLLLTLPMLVAQETISLLNPSFEDEQRAGKPPSGWQDCGFPGETPPDIQPGEFGVTKEAYDGGTYLGMVVRDNDSWERIGQKLNKPFQADSAYQFSIFLCRSEIYLSLSQLTRELVQYNTPVTLRIWGGDSPCSKNEKLAESDLITSIEWEQHEFQFAPTENHTYILLEAFYEIPALFTYNGNILLDNASDIIPISKDSAIISSLFSPNLEILKLNIYPTLVRAQKTLSVDLSTMPNDPIVFSIINQLGQVMKVQTINGGVTSSMDIHSLPNGHYWIKGKQERNQLVGEFTIAQ